MAEQTFRSPGFFEREIDLSGRRVEPTGTPAGVIGAAERGPAFIPVTIGSDEDFVARFGEMDPNRAGPYAVREYLKNKDAITFMRVLGAGSNDTAAEISNTRTYGFVSKAGIKLSGSIFIPQVKAFSHGEPVFLAASHYVSTSVESHAFPEFTDNNSFPGLGSGDDYVQLVRAMIFPTTGSRICLAHMSASALAGTDVNTVNSQTTHLDDNYKFKIIVKYMNCL